MITRPFAQTLYRIHNPRWAYLPTSGAGAAKHGGRANRPGVEALYLSSDVDTALAEYQQAAPVLPPGTIVSYTVSLSKIADFSAGFQSAHWHPIWEDFFCDWRKLVLDKIEPPSWVASDQIMAAECRGLLFPSVVRNGGLNLVVYNGSLTGGDTLQVNDPNGDLPSDQASWR